MAKRRHDDEGELHRENVPGQLDHASAEVDLAEASIVAGAAGLPADEPPADVGRALKPAREDDGGSGGRVGTFLRASWAELQRVQWPDRRQVGQATAVVLGFVILAGGYLGLADFVAQRIVDAII